VNKLSKLIIRALGPKPKQGEILIMPYVTKSQKGILKARKVIHPDTGANAADSTSGDAPVKTLPGQIPLDEALKSDISNGDSQCKMTTAEINNLWEKE